ncbi:hypothetical protein ABZ485_24985 [Streptomyces albogriseolus]|uniref:hypothetical protein n=1 Tax=Streptomyces albogriseolus TaxID=1887 RepID=UPI00346176BE
MPRPRKKRRREITKVPRSDAMLPEYDRRVCPEGLVTRRQLREKGLSPGGHGPVAVLRCKACAYRPDQACIHPTRAWLYKPAPGLVEIRDNLLDRIAEAEREGWLGELEGLQISLSGAEGKLAQLDAEEDRRAAVVDLGMPAFSKAAVHTADIGGPGNPRGPGKKHVTCVTYW